MTVGPRVGNLALVTGCFDVIHRGHIDLLRQASQLGVLRVGVNTDEAIRQLKGPSRPVNNEDDRVAVLNAIEYVNRFGGFAFLIPSTKVTQAFLDVRPHYWVKGGDWSIDTLDKEEVAAAKEVGAEIIIVPHRAGYSTTETLRKLQS